MINPVSPINPISPVLSARPVGDASTEPAGRLPFQAGQSVAARVVSADSHGAVLTIAGRTLRVEADMVPRLIQGQTITLQVVSASPGALALRRLDNSVMGGGPDTLSQSQTVRRDLAAALASLGVTVDEGNLLAAQALIRFGVPLNGDNLGDIRRRLASGAAKRAETVALAKSLNLPTTPAILRALDTLLEARDDPSLMTITVPMRADTAGIAAQLEMTARAATRSVEHKLLTGDIDGARADLRSYLLRRAVGGDAEAEQAARHLEGQLLTNAARQRLEGGDNAVFMAFIASSGRHSHHVEMRFRHHEIEEYEADGEVKQHRQVVSAVVHLPTANLGVVTARLLLRPDGGLDCRLTTADAEGLRRITRSAGHLTVALQNAGFPHTTTVTGRAAPTDAYSGDTPRHAAMLPLRALDRRA